MCRPAREARVSRAPLSRHRCPRVGSRTRCDRCRCETYCLGTITNLLGEDRLATVPRATLDYDFEAWLDDLDGRPLNQFAWPLPRRVRFALTKEQFTLVESALDKFGRHDLGRGKALIRINPNVLWRRPMVDAR